MLKTFCHNTINIILFNFVDPMEENYIAKVYETYMFCMVKYHIVVNFASTAEEHHPVEQSFHECVILCSFLSREILCSLFDIMTGDN